MKRLYPERPVVGVGAVVICDGRILLERRKVDPGKGKWTIPGGVVELGERAEQTVIREVKEETNLEVKEPRLIDVVNTVTLDKDKRVKYHFVIVDFFVKLVGGVLAAADDAAELKWVEFDEVGDYNLTRSFREFFNRNCKRLEKLNSCL
ncbi:NUDIX domain-containing protein [Candidatus Bathyarchaeota archaeon]|nr:NUDIX domain-containing protein [Candidatus Bathyarchaeota archaeon]